MLGRRPDVGPEHQLAAGEQVHADPVPRRPGVVEEGHHPGERLVVRPLAGQDGRPPGEDHDIVHDAQPNRVRGCPGR
ncbi:MAG: hypothetical protein ACRD0C_11825, partial [Acidimicrobiia bacterium]